VAPSEPSSGNFFQRFAKAYSDDWKQRPSTLVRPEIRFERSYDVPAYDNGSKKNQLMLAGDIIYFF